MHIARVRMPSWPHWNYDWLGEGLLAYVTGVFLFTVVLPLVAVLLLLPIAGVRALVSPVRWVVAYSSWPSQIKLIWKTHKDDAAAVAEYVATKLPEGYGGLTPPGAERVYMTRPAGFNDLDR